LDWLSDFLFFSKVSLTRMLLRLGDFLPEYRDPQAGTIADGQPWLEVKPSLIKDAGEGLFAKADVAEGTTICHYLGTRKGLLDVLRTRDLSYVYKFSLFSFIDAQEQPDVLARYVNHHFDPKARNSEFFNDGNKAWLVASRDIRAGEELYTDYGYFYWYVLGDSSVMFMEENDEE